MKETENIGYFTIEFQKKLKIANKTIFNLKNTTRRENNDIFHIL